MFISVLGVEQLFKSLYNLNSQNFTQCKVENLIVWSGDK